MELTRDHSLPRIPSPPRTGFIGLGLVVLLAALALAFHDVRSGEAATLFRSWPLALAGWAIVAREFALARRLQAAAGLLAFAALAAVVRPDDAAFWLRHGFIIAGLVLAGIGLMLPAVTRGEPARFLLWTLSSAQGWLVLITLHAATVGEPPMPVVAMLGQAILALLAFLDGRRNTGTHGVAMSFTTAAAGIAVLVAVGWWLGNATIVQAGTAFVPMQFNTAMSVLCLAVAAWLAERDRRGIALLLIMPVLAVAVATLIEEIGGSDFGVGNWLVAHSIVAEHVLPGRMATNTAIALLTIAVGIAVMPAPGATHALRSGITWFCGLSVCVLAIFVLTGYLLELPTMRAWGNLTPMALLTATSLLMLGLTLATLRFDHSPYPQRSRIWTPLLVSIAGIALVTTVWLAASRSTQQVEQHNLESQVALAADVAANQAQERAGLLRRAATRAAAASPSERARSFARDADRYFEDFTGLQFIALLAADQSVIAEAAREPALAACLHRSLLQGRSRSPVIDTCTPTPLLLSRPAPDESAAGLQVVAAFDLARTLQSQLAMIGASTPLRLATSDRVLLQRGVRDGAPVVMDFVVDTSLPAVIEVWPSRGAGDAQGVLNALLLIGTAACGLLALSMRLAGLSRERARVAELRGQELEAQGEATQRLQSSLLRAQEIAGLGGWEFDPAYGELTWSEALNAVFGLTPEQAPKSIEQIAQLVHEDDRARWQHAHDQVLAGGDHLQVEFRSVDANGTIRHMHERARMLRRANGAPWLLTATVQDVSERKHMTAALTESEQRFRLIARATADALWDWDIQRGKVWYSEGMRLLFGVKDGLRDSNVSDWSEHIHPDDCQRVIASIDATLRGEQESWSSEYRYQRGDGQYALVLDRGFVIRDANGEAVRMLGGMSDVTEHRNIQILQLRINRALRLLSACGDALFRADDETWLVERICQLATTVGQYPLAWIGYALDDHAQSIRPMAIGGTATRLVQDNERPWIWGDVAAGASGAPGRAIHGSVPVVVRDLGSEADDHAAEALAAGMRAMICLPLQNRDRSFGLLVLYSDEALTATPPELSILQDLADNLSQGIAALRLRQEQAQLHDALAQVAAAVSGDRGNVFFRNLVTNMANALGGRGGFLFRLAAPDATEAQLLAGVVDGIALDDGDYRIAGTPLVELLHGDIVAVDWSAPSAEHLPGMPRLPGATLYGLRLDNAAGLTVGLLGLLHDGPTRESIIMPALRIFGARAGAELDRLTRERFIREQAALLDKAREAIFVCDENACVSYWNPGAERLFGHARSSAIGMELLEFMHTDSGEITRLLQELRQQGEWHGYLEVRHQDGHMLDIEAHWTLVHNDQDSHSSLLCIANDVSERKRMLAQLRDSESRLKAILDTAAEGIITTDAQGHIKSMNPHALSIFDYEEEELIGRNLGVLMPEPLSNEHDGFIRRYLDTGLMALPSTGRQLLGRRRDGSIFPIELSVRDVALASGRLFTGFVRDITRRREAEQAMQQLLRDLDNRNRELQEFVFVASHDLQEPLRKIRAFSDRVLQTQGERLDEQGRDFLQRATNAAERMQTLINDLLAYSRVTSKKREFEPVDLNVVVAAVLDDLEPRLESCAGKVAVERLPTLNGDPTQLHQLFQNLIGNSLKYSAPGRAPEVHVSAESITTEDGPAWRIRVTDNGIGFDTRHAERIFAPFQRLHARHEYEGSGIGLAIVKRIVEHHNGTVTAEGRPGEGATFEVVLPCV